VADVAESGEKLICKNRRAFFQYDVQDRLEAGLVLRGGEVKSLRVGGGDLHPLGPVARRPPHRPEGVHRLRQRELLAGAARDEAAAADRPARLERAIDAQQLAPGRRVLPGEEVAEDHAVAAQVLLGEPLQDLRRERVRTLALGGGAAGVFRTSASLREPTGAVDSRDQSGRQAGQCSVHRPARCSPRRSSSGCARSSGAPSGRRCARSGARSASSWISGRRGADSGDGLAPEPAFLV